MDQALLNDIISTSVGGAAGGAVAGIVIMTIQGIRASWLLRRDANRAYNWLVKNSDKATPFRSTRSIASHTNLTEDRVRFVCSQDRRIKLSTGEKADVWSIHIRRRSSSFFTGISEET